jgi:hypothetical protein
MQTDLAEQASDVFAERNGVARGESLGVAMVGELAKSEASVTIALASLSDELEPRPGHIFRVTIRWHGSGSRVSQAFKGNFGPCGLKA